LGSIEPRDGANGGGQMLRIRLFKIGKGARDQKRDVSPGKKRRVSNYTLTTQRVVHPGDMAERGKKRSGGGGGKSQMSEPPTEGGMGKCNTT